VNLLAGLDKEKGEALRKKYEKQLDHYASDKEDVSEQAKEMEAERDLAARRADRFDGGEALLEIGLVICSITLLAKRKIFWFAGMAIGALGVVQAVTGFFHALSVTANYALAGGCGARSVASSARSFCR